MKKTACIFLALLLFAGCTQVAATVHIAETTDTAAAGSLEPVREPEPVEVTQAPVETEPPDAGIGSVVMELPETLTRTPENQDEPLTVTFSGIDPTGEPESGRLCSLTLLREGKPVGTRQHIVLEEGMSLELPLDCSFSRYQADRDETLTVQLGYKGEVVEKELSLHLENWPDEVYVRESGDKQPYAIDVLRSENVVVVYGKDEAGEYNRIVHVFLCSTGKATPSGRYSLGAKSDWCALFGGVYGQYSIRVVGNILFHSVPYYSMSKSRLESAEFNKLGTKASMGCIRMAVADVKWIYDNCPVGTSVHIYDVDELPVEKPEPILIDLEDPRAGWDPTDPDPENPWLVDSD